MAKLPKRLTKSINFNVVPWISADIKNLSMGLISSMGPFRILYGRNGLSGMVSSHRKLHLFRIQVRGVSVDLEL